MNIKETIAAINRMQADGVIDRYAIGGAVGATFYLEPVATLDVDVFIDFRPEAHQLVVSPQPIFEYLKARGGTMQGEYIVVAGWPIQFLPPGTALVEEALKESGERDVDGTLARVFTAAPRRHRPPDRARQGQARLLHFVEAGALDAARFRAILTRHGLLDRWRQFERQFLTDTP